MSVIRYLILMIFSLVISFAIYYLVIQFGSIEPYYNFFAITAGFFVIFSSLIFLATKFLTTKERKGSFISLVMLNVFLKLVLSFGVVYWFVSQYEPTSKWFIFPFLINYLLFTILETYALTKLAER